ASVASGPGRPFGPAMMRRYHNAQFNQGISAEMLADCWKLSRASLDEYSLQSHHRAARATEQGWFCREILPTPVVREDGTTVVVSRDEGIRPDTTLEKMATLKTVFKTDGVVTAANSSQITDGAAAVLIMERSLAERLGSKPLARFVEFALAGADPVMMLSAPIPATARVLARAGLKLGDIDRV